MVYQNKFVAVVKVNGKILREFDEKVKIPFGSEYSVLLKNLHSQTAVVNLSIDGQDAFHGTAVVIKPNSEQEIEGYIENGQVTNRFKFIEKTQQISDYRGDRVDDGIIRIEYRFEKHQPSPHRDVFVTKEHSPRPKDLPKHPFPYHIHPLSSNFSEEYSDDHIDLISSNSSKQYSEDLSRRIDSSASVFSHNQFGHNQLATANYDGITVKGSEINDTVRQVRVGELEESSSVIVFKLTGEQEKKK